MNDTYLNTKIHNNGMQTVPIQRIAASSLTAVRDTAKRARFFSRAFDAEVPERIELNIAREYRSFLKQQNEPLSHLEGGTRKAITSKLKERLRECARF